MKLSEEDINFLNEFEQVNHAMKLPMLQLQEISNELQNNLFSLARGSAFSSMWLV